MNEDYRFSDAIGMDWVETKMSGLVFPDVTKKSGQIKKPFMGVLCLKGNDPKGMILGLPNAMTKSVRLMSLKVGQNYVNGGIAQNLLQKMEEELKDKGFQSMELFFRSHWDSKPVLEHLLSKMKWTEPSFFLRHYQLEADKAQVAFSQNLNLPDGYSVSPWGGLTEDEKQHIDNKYTSQSRFPAELSPFALEQVMENEMSMALKYQNTIIGWLCLSIISKETLEYTALFLDPDHRKSIIAPSLMATVINRQVEQGVYPKMTFSVKGDNQPMLNFLNQNRQESTIRTDVFRSEKSLI